MKLADLRKGLRITHAELAALLGLSQEGLAKLEQMPLDGVSVGALRRYAAALGARFALLFPDGREVSL